MKFLADILASKVNEYFDNISEDVQYMIKELDKCNIDAHNTTNSSIMSCYIKKYFRTIIFFRSISKLNRSVSTGIIQVFEKKRCLYPARHVSYIYSYL